MKNGVRQSYHANVPERSLLRLSLWDKATFRDTCDSCVSILRKFFEMVGTVQSAKSEFTYVCERGRGRKNEKAR